LFSQRAKLRDAVACAQHSREMRASETAQRCWELSADRRLRMSVSFFPLFTILLALQLNYYASITSVVFAISQIALF